MKFTKEYKIGLAVFAAIIILILGINFLKGKSLFKKDTEYLVYFEKIDGLKVGSYVLTRGFKVGVVKDIQFDGDMAERMKVSFLINENIRFASDSKVRIFSMDLMGTRGLEIITGSSKELKNNGDVFIGEIEGSFKDEIGRQIAPLKNKAERLLSSLDSIFTSIQIIVNVDTQAKIKQSLGSVGRTLKSLESASSSIDNIVSSKEGSLSNLISNTESITLNLRKNNEKISNILSNISSITDTLNSDGLGSGLNNIGESLANLNRISASLATDKSSMGAMINNRELYNNLNETVSNLNRVVLDLEKNPKKYIKFSMIDFGGSTKYKDKFLLVAFVSNTKLENDKKTSNLEEVFYKGKYLYVLKRYSKENKAVEYLKKTKKEYPNAYIQKIKD
jgi:phospholipid/cholesterol/gamma-HCH transport system substrate-binding protein